MKNLKLKFVMFAVVLAGIFTAFAFSPAKADSSTQASLHWFDAEDETYLGQRTEAQQRILCGPDGNIACADGYTGVSGNSPAGLFITTMNKQ